LGEGDTILFAATIKERGGRKTGRNRGIGGPGKHRKGVHDVPAICVLEGGVPLRNNMQPREGKKRSSCKTGLKG